MNKILERVKHVLLLVALLAFLSFASCDNKDLNYYNLHMTNVKVVFDWAKDPEAAPASTSLYLFPTRGGRVLRYEFTDPKGGTIRVPTGNYDAICINSDTENIIYRNTESKMTFEVTTRPVDMNSNLSSLDAMAADLPRAKGTEDETIVMAPEKLWTDHAEGIAVKLDTVVPTITLHPEVSVCQYTIEIFNAQNLKYVNSIIGTVSGLTGGLLPGVGPYAITRERVTVPFDVLFGDSKAERTTISSTLFTFGDYRTDDNHTLSIYVILGNGEKWYYTYDITDQFHSAPDPRNVHIILDGLPVPKPIVNGGGFQPQVGDWHTVPIDIKM